MKKITTLVSTYTLLLLLFSSTQLYCQSTSIDEQYPILEKLYKHLHANPELSFLEEQTAAKLAVEMKELGFEVTEKVGGTGLVCILKNGTGKTVLVRADMDALPIKEDTNLPYSSDVIMKDINDEEMPVMHACGHDIHMTVWYGTARNMAANKNAWKGTLVFIAQPAEERSGGAKAMLADGLYERFPVPDYAISLHVSAVLRAGSLGWCPEYAMANVDMMQIRIKGKGGHGAYPHTTIDPVSMSARLINDLQTIVSREISPLEPAVVTVGSIHGGTKGNVIPDEVVLELTLRSYTDEVRNKIIELIKLKCIAIGVSAGLPESMFPEVILHDEFTPALFNDLALNERIALVFEKEFGVENVIKTDPVMGGEDFGRYGRTKDKVPIMMFWLGAVENEKYEAAQRGDFQLPSLHNSKFQPDPEPTLKTGVKALTVGILELMN